MEMPINELIIAVLSGRLTPSQAAEETSAFAATCFVPGTPEGEVALREIREIRRALDQKEAADREAIRAREIMKCACGHSAPRTQTRVTTFGRLCLACAAEAEGIEQGSGGKLSEEDEFDDAEDGPWTGRHS